MRPGQKHTLESLGKIGARCYEQRLPPLLQSVYVPNLPHWTLVGILPDATKQRQGVLAGSGFEDVPGAPISLRDANRMHEYGLLVKANRRNGKAIEVIFMTPHEKRHP